MRFELPELPFATDALEPHMSAETLRFHHGKHHAGYVKKLNDLLDQRSDDPDGLEELIHESQGAVFQNAAQAWNHEFFWSCLSPEGGGEPAEDLTSALSEGFGSVDGFREEFTRVAKKHFGSGWAWLVQTKERRLEVTSTNDADNPMRVMRKPLLTCDLWEHAYYIDHRNDRGAYLESFWKMVNWNALADRLQWSPAAESGSAR